MKNLNKINELKLLTENQVFFNICDMMKRSEKQMAINTDNWVPACGGTEKPFTTRTGRVLHYMWNTTTGEHAYYDVKNDVFLSNDEATEAIAVY